MDSVQRPLDDVDLSLLATLRRHPRASHAELARTVHIARGTVYSRLERLEREGVISGYAPAVDAAAAGFGILAFTTLEIRQGSHDATIDGLASIPEVIEIYTVTGAGDLLCKIIARSNDHLHLVLQDVAGLPTVVRSQSQLALNVSHRRSVLDVVVGPSER